MLMRRARAPRGARSSLWRVLRWVHQRLQVADGVDLVVVDNVKVHGTRRHEQGALCAAMTTDGLRHGLQHEIAWLLEYPFPNPGRIPGMVVQLARYVKHLNDNAVYIRAGDVLDIHEDTCEIGAFGALGQEGAPSVRSIAFAPAPMHDEYWMGEHEFRVPPYPTLLATVLGGGERAYIGAVGGASPVFAAQMQLFRYAPALPYVPSARIVGQGGEGAPPRPCLSRMPIAEGGDLALQNEAELLDVTPEALPAPVRLNNSTLVLRGKVLTLTVPAAVGEMIAPAFAEMLAERKDAAVTFLADPVAECDAALPLVPKGAEEAPTLDDPVLLPTQPSRGREVLRTAAGGEGGLKLGGSGVVLKYYPDDVHLDGFDTVDQAGANLADADHCDVALASDNHLFVATLRHRSWVKLLDAISKQKGLVIPAREPGGVHFEVRWTRGNEMPLYQQQAAKSAEAFKAMKAAGLDAFKHSLGGDDAPVEGAKPAGTTPSTPPPAGADEDDILQLDAPDAKGKKRKLVLYTGTGDADSMTEEQKLKLRMAGGGSLLKQSLSELAAPMTAAQYEKYTNELNAHKTLAEEVKTDMAVREQERLEGNIIRVVWSYDEASPNALPALEEELASLAEYWSRYKTRLVSVVMFWMESHLDHLTLADRDQGTAPPDLSPNVCIRVLPSAVTDQPDTVYGLLVKDALIPADKVQGLTEELGNDEMLGGCPLSFGFDVFVNVSRRGAYAGAQRRTAHWADLEKHYRSLSDDAMARVAELEAQQQRLAAKEAELAAREAALQKATPPPSASTA
eukprot:TRINITY_DN32247_c0_g1_i1.p1 TRINITY_DN32247_c0_g1~~TRINITY_DN32247_c0_g1_i1.p1  ORF type:complete len:792 (+),score=308.32 TRINITY_DN32247_c0_g1_i1:72-2447(+)